MRVSAYEMIEGKKYMLYEKGVTTGQIRIRKDTNTYSIADNGKLILIADISFYSPSSYFTFELINEVKTMNFIEACLEMKKGKTVRRVGWNLSDSDKYGFLIKNDKIVSNTGCAFGYNDFDIRDTDWVVVEKQPKVVKLNSGHTAKVTDKEVEVEKTFGFKLSSVDLDNLVQARKDYINGVS